MLRRRAVLAPVAALVAAAFVLAGVSVWALEGGEVAVLRTLGPEGRVRETRVWLADFRGDVWLEAATPERAWYRDVLRNPRVELVRDGERRVYRAEALRDPPAHERVRRLLRERYGWADAWVGFVQDTSRSVAVRLRPVSGGGATRGSGSR